MVCGFPATCEDPAAEATLAFPIGDPNYVEAFLETRKKGNRGTYQTDRPHGDHGERIDPSGTILLLSLAQLHLKESGTPLKDYSTSPSGESGYPLGSMCR